MTWFSDFAAWFTSSEALPWIYGGIVVFVSMLVSAFVAARLARGTANKLVAQRDFELRVGAIATLVDAAHDATQWSQLSEAERAATQRAVAKAETLVRMLPIRGADIAANWAAYQLAEIKRSAETATPMQLQPMVTDFRDRLLEWQKSPSRARRGFSNDLARWSTQPATAAATAERAERGAQTAAAVAQFEVAPPVPASSASWSPDAEAAQAWAAEAAADSNGDVSWAQPPTTAPVDIPVSESNAEAADADDDANKG